MQFKPIPQKDSMGCAVACVASILGISYKKSLKFFGIKKADKPNFYCRDIAKILNKKGFNYSYGKVIPKTEKYLKNSGTIVFIRRSKKFPFGHYLLKTKNGWMNSWINFPKIPIKAGFQKKLLGIPQWLIYKT
ncbi:hypothetical protein HY449_01995 [Candidatus Pacearchaeota archaeon]|nr:hypothetical protein [Candidatus Pacearchaeota archaeon]